jgi:enediyne biosynthesis protein E4
LRLVLPLLVLLGVGAGLAYWLLKPPPTAIKTVTPGPTRVREVAEVPTIKFTDVTAEAGLNFQHVSGAFGMKLLPETMGGGVAILDYDGDGKPDVLFVNSCEWPGVNASDTATPKLFRNLGNGKFDDVTERVGLNVTMYGMGVAVGDFDNDSRPDLFISCVGQHKLFRNVDGKTFADVTASAGVGGAGQLPKCSKDEFLAWAPPIPIGSSATFLDYDRDGKLDLFVCHYVSWSPVIDKKINATLDGTKRSYAQPREYDGSYCSLYRNVDGKRFEDVSAPAGVRVSEKEGTDANSRVRAVAKALGVIVCDPDGDGWPDLVVANDLVRNFFLHNTAGADGKRVYIEAGLKTGTAYPDTGTPRGGMGIDVYDDEQNRCCVVVANFATEPLTYMRQDGPKKLLFTDTALAVGLSGPSRTPLKFGSFFFDFDNDGRQDLLVCNGHLEPEIATVQASQRYAQPVQLYWNSGPSFEPVDDKHAGADLFKPLVGRGSVYFDYDGDGDLDVILVANGAAARLLRNDASPTQRSIRLDLRGDGQSCNRSAIGAEVSVTVGGKTYRRTITGARGYLSQPESVATVGVGKAEKVDTVVVRWPNRAGTTQTWTDLPTGQTHVLTMKP